MESMQAMIASMPKAGGDDDSRVEPSIKNSKPKDHASSDTEGDQEGLCDAEDSVNLGASVPGQNLTYSV
jgi:hypothetical protein